MADPRLGIDRLTRKAYGLPLSFEGSGSLEQRPGNSRLLSSEADAAALL